MIATPLPSELVDAWRAGLNGRAPDAVDFDGLFETEAWHDHPLLGDFLHGRCHILAVALGRATGKEIGVVIDENWDTGKPFMAHAFVWDDPERTHVLDVKGRRSVESMVNDFDLSDPDDPDLQVFTEKEVLKWGEGRVRLDDEAKAFLAQAEALSPLLLALVEEQRVLVSEAAPKP